MAFDDVLSGIGGLISTGYQLYTNKRDFDYQKALQQQIFEREDTAVQRRMNDLKAAGINPNLAAGSAASAGSVVGRSDTQNVNFGTILDTLMAKKQLQAQNVQNDILKYQKNQAYYDSRAHLYDTQMKGYEQQMASDWFTYLYGDYKEIEFMKQNNPKLYEYLDFQFNNAKNSSEMLQKENNWFTTNQIIGALGNVAKDFSYFTPSFIKRLK